MGAEKKAEEKKKNVGSAETARPPGEIQAGPPRDGLLEGEDQLWGERWIFYVGEQVTAHLPGPPPMDFSRYQSPFFLSCLNSSIFSNLLVAARPPALYRRA